MNNSFGNVLPFPCLIGTVESRFYDFFSQRLHPQVPCHRSPFGPPEKPPKPSLPRMYQTFANSNDIILNP